MEEVKALGVQDFLMSGDQNIELKNETEVAKMRMQEEAANVWGEPRGNFNGHSCCGTLVCVVTSTYVSCGKGGLGSNLLHHVPSTLASLFSSTSGVSGGA